MDWNVSIPLLVDVLAFTLLIRGYLSNYGRVPRVYGRGRNMRSVWIVFRVGYKSIQTAPVSLLLFHSASVKYRWRILQGYIIACKRTQPMQILCCFGMVMKRSVTCKGTQEDCLEGGRKREAFARICFYVNTWWLRQDSSGYPVNMCDRTKICLHSLNLAKQQQGIVENWIPRISHHRATRHARP